MGLPAPGAHGGSSPASLLLLLEPAARPLDVISYAFLAAAGLVPAANADQQQDQAALLEQVLATLAQLQAGQAQMQATVAQLQAGQAQMEAGLDNMRRRTQNSHAYQVYPTHTVPLAPLVKEQPPLAGAAAVGALPPLDTFPATWTAVQEVGAR